MTIGSRIWKENFRRKDIVFECFHNFLAFSQWGNMLYNVMSRLEPNTGDPAVRSWFARTMKDSPDEMDASAFTRLDRFVMELFRTISPNTGSVSALAAQRQAFGERYTLFNAIVTSHPETSRDPVHWTNPDDFDPDRYKQAPTTEQNDEARCKQVGLAQCPFNREDYQVKDGRHASITNSVFVPSTRGSTTRPIPSATTPATRHSASATAGVRASSSTMGSSKTS